jgi:hypothetical protein
MAYATIEELATALRVRPTETNTDALQTCLDAAAEEIDHEVDWLDVDAEHEPDALLNRVNIVRAVEWWKAQDAAFGVIGFDQAGALQAPRDGFNRHAYALTPRKEQWGIA